MEALDVDHVPDAPPVPTVRAVRNRAWMDVPSECTRADWSVILLLMSHVRSGSPAFVFLASSSRSAVRTINNFWYKTVAAANGNRPGTLSCAAYIDGRTSMLPVALKMLSTLVGVGACAVSPPMALAA